MWQPKQSDGALAEHSNKDFRTSAEERGLSKHSRSWWFPVTGIALIVLLLLYVSLVR